MTAPIRKHLFGKPLTAKQSMVWGMKEAGKTRPEIAALMGVSISVVSKQIQYIRRKLGLAVREAPHAFSTSDASSSKMLAPAKNHTGPQELVENAVDQVNQAMQNAGFQERIRSSLVRRLNVKHNGEETPLKAIADAEMKDNLRKQIFLIDSYVDDKVVSEASLRDLAVAKSQLIEKLQLLEGRPTQIISDLERKQLVELMPLLFAEAKRRGVTYDGQITEKVVNPA